MRLFSSGKRQQQGSSQPKKPRPTSTTTTSTRKVGGKTIITKTTTTRAAAPAAAPQLTKAAREAPKAPTQSFAMPKATREELKWALMDKASLGKIRQLVDSNPGILRETDEYGWTPLHWACRYSAPFEVIQWLVDRFPGALEMKNKYGDTPLHLACCKKAPLEVIQLLVDRFPGAVEMKDKDGKTPLDYCDADTKAKILEMKRTALQRQRLQQQREEEAEQRRRAEKEKAAALRQKQEAERQFAQVCQNQRATWKSSKEIPTRAALEQLIQECQSPPPSSLSRAQSARHRATQLQRQAALPKLRPVMPDQATLASTIGKLNEIAESFPDTVQGTERKAEFYEEIAHWEARLEKESVQNNAQMARLEQHSSVGGVSDKDIEKGREIVVACLEEAAPAKPVPQSYIDFLTGRFHRTNKIGSGGFGTVYKGEDRQASISVAVKTIMEDRMSESEKANFESEIKNLSTLSHPNIIGLLGWCTNDDKYSMVLEYAAGGSVHSILCAKDSRQKFTPVARLYAAHALVDAVAYLHREKIFHRDIKPENLCMLDNWETNPKLLLIDFGIAHNVAKAKSATSLSSHPGTLPYMAPEYRDPPYDFDAKSEVFSIGVVIMVLLTGHSSFSSYNPRACSPSDLLRNVDSSAGEWSAQSDNKLAAVACKCVSVHPRDRDDTTTLLEALGKIRSEVDHDLTPENRATLTRYESRSRPSRLKQATTPQECVRCGRRTTKGVLCKKNHLTCIVGTCLEDLVREQLGATKFDCCGVGCAKKFALEDVYGKISTKLFIDAIGANESIQRKEEANHDLIESIDSIVKERLAEHSREMRGAIQDSNKAIVAELAVVQHSSLSMVQVKGDIEKILKDTKSMAASQETLERSIRDKESCITTGDDVAEEIRRLRMEMEALSLQQARSVAGLASGRLQCPQLCLLVPVRTHKGWKKKMKSVVVKEYQLIFLCAHDFSPVNTTIKIKEARAWVRRALPYVKFALMSLRILATVYAIPTPNLPDFIPGASVKEKFENAMEEMTSLLDKEDLEDIETWLDDVSDESDWKRLLSEKDPNMDPEAFGAVVVEAYKPKNRSWMKDMDIYYKEEKYAWVKNENADAWKASIP